jgi:hypothetical protein
MSKTFPTPAVERRAAGLLLLLALHACGGANSTSTSAVAPSITTQPAAQSVAVGASASFSVVATGSGQLAYQWRKDGTALSGATSATYAIAAVATSQAGSYDVVVSNSAGSVTSSAATLTVTGGTTAPAIVTSPVSQSVALGTSVTFSVTASGAAPLSYQWRKNSTAISGATSASYTISSAAATDAGNYDVVVSNSAGSATSAVASLTVTTSTGSGLSAQATAAANAFLATLSASQQATAKIDFSVTNARRWSNLPAALSGRNGINWGSLTTAQQTAARTLITTALSTAGNTLHVGMQAADDYLAANGGGSSYGNGQFYIVILGTPSASSFWMLQLTGHHLTFNLAFNGTYKSPTPLFLGVEPKGAFTQGGVSYDPMLAQRTAVSGLGAALLAYPGAKLTGTYADLLFGANGAGGIDNTCPRAYASVTERGALYSSLSAADQTLVQAVITAYVNTQANEYATELLGNYLSATSLASTYVAYAGTGTVTTNGNYFRIDGPRVWIEFSVQRGIIFNSDIHFHTIWRDKVGDYGGACQ